VRDISATEAARRFSEVLDAVEHGRESFRVVRAGRAVARLVPADAASGRAAKELLGRHRVDRAWFDELAELRALLVAEERAWRG
jgi:prevent-host-death family protein